MTHMFIQTKGQVPVKLANKLSASLEPLWTLYTKEYRPDIDLMIVVEYSKAFTQLEDDKPVEYPETLEIKFEADSNFFYSVRAHDFMWVPEGASLDGIGQTSGCVCSKIRRDLMISRPLRIRGGTMSTKHTPGPWFVDEESPLDVRTNGVGKLMWICDAPDGYDTSNIEGMKQREANARLIAAAPDLLEALEVVLCELEAQDIHAPARIAFAKAAIAKATGGAL